MEGMCNLNLLIQQIFEEERQKEIERKLLSTSEDKIDTLNKNIEAVKSRIVKLSVELEEMENVIRDMDEDLILMEVRRNSWLESYKNTFKSHENTRSKLSKLKKKFRKNANEFCDKTNIFINNYGFNAWMKKKLFENPNNTIEMIFTNNYL